jgi:hypothetical protein
MPGGIIPCGFMKGGGTMPYGGGIIMLAGGIHTGGNGGGIMPGYIMLGAICIMPVHIGGIMAPCQAPGIIPGNIEGGIMALTG